MRKSDIDMRN